MKILQGRRALAVAAGMKKTNDPAEPTQRKKTTTCISETVKC